MCDYGNRKEGTERRRQEARGGSNITYHIVKASEGMQAKEGMPSEERKKMLH